VTVSFCSACAPTNHWKLGLFVLVGSLLGLASVLWLGAHALQKETVTYRTYFDEAVAGLSVGSSVTYRGVAIGNVSDVDVAPDRRHVEITYQLGVTELERLGIATRKGRNIQLSTPPDLRAQLSTSGITGTKYLKIDFFDADKNPPPVLPFRTKGNTIPAAPSTLKNLEEALTRVIDQLPELVTKLSVVLSRVDNVVAQVDEAALPDKASLALDRADKLLSTLQGEVQRANIDQVAGEAKVTMEQLHAMLQRMDGERGLLASLQRVTDSVGDITTGARGVGPELDGTLRDLRGAADSVRQLVDAIEREPDMLVKGRSPR
jgi:phospholipid/cholesterol/gamma-HCH transport system substrate-binding protein